MNFVHNSPGPPMYMHFPRCLSWEFRGQVYRPWQMIVSFAEQALGGNLRCRVDGTWPVWTITRSGGQNMTRVDNYAARVDTAWVGWTVTWKAETGWNIKLSTQNPRPRLTLWFRRHHGARSIHVFSLEFARPVVTGWVKYACLATMLIQDRSTQCCWTNYSRTKFPRINILTPYDRCDFRLLVPTHRCDFFWRTPHNRFSLNWRPTPPGMF